MSGVTINLWFTNEAEEAAQLYTSIFPDSAIHTTTYYPETGQEITGGKPGSVLTVGFRANGQEFIALNGGDVGFHFNESISLLINCETQEEIDTYWAALTADGGQESQCGWLKDKFGVSWQIATPVLDRLIASEDKTVANRVMNAMLQMKKLDIAALEAAARDEEL